MRMNTTTLASPTNRPWQPWLPPQGRKYWANSGGPSSRTRTEEIHSTLLGDDEGPIRCPRVMQVAIDFGRRRPLKCARDWLKAAGFADEHEARAALSLPLTPCICRPDPAPRPIAAAALAAIDGLGLALVLGLCTPSLYDPRRPVLWTEASLLRRLLLYDGGGFYA
jgi:hypothetical protein